MARADASGASGVVGFVDVEAASRIGGALARRRPSPASYRPGALEAQLTELSLLATDRVSLESGLVPPTPPVARVVDRAEWVAANVASVERLVGPAAAALAARRRVQPPAVVDRWSRRSSAAQLGAVLAWLSSRVLGQYDLLVGEEASKDEDVISYVGPNIVALEQRHGFDADQFRLWLALHETAHRAQFTGAPWVRTYFLGLVEEVVGAMSLDVPTVLSGAVRSFREVAEGTNPMAELGPAGIFATDAQRDALRRLTALMSVLEGHGEVVMDVAAQDLVPSASRFHDVLRDRRAAPGAMAKVLGQLLGLDAKMRQYADGERFVRSLRDAGGPGLVAELFSGPEAMPTMAELLDPTLWLARSTAALR
jgi:coenzyme F420 biosynthesis associated uncharacterized protein